MSYLAPVTAGRCSLYTPRWVQRAASAGRQTQRLQMAQIHRGAALWWLVSCDQGLRSQGCQTVPLCSWIAGAKLSPSTFFQANNVQSPYFKYILKVWARLVKFLVLWSSSVWDEALGGSVLAWTGSVVLRAFVSVPKQGCNTVWVDCDLLLRTLLGLSCWMFLWTCAHLKGDR